MIEQYYDISQVPYKRESRERILTGFPELDYYTKGLSVGITLLVANTNVGKSTLVQNILARAIEQGYKSWVFSGEHTADSFLQLLYHQNSTKKDYIAIPYRDCHGERTNIVDWYVTEEKEEELKSKFAGNIFIYSNKARRDIDTIIESMVSCRKEQGARFFIIDNMISIDNISSNVYAEQTMITEKIRMFALNYKCIVLLVAHQRKSSNRDGFLLDIQDVAGSQNISNKAYNVIAQYRSDMLPKESGDYEYLKKCMAKCGFDIEKCDGVLQVLKTKGNGCGFVGITYDRDTLTYRQSTKISKTEADRVLNSKQIRIEEIAMSDDTNPFDSDVSDTGIPF